MKNPDRRHGMPPLIYVDESIPEMRAAINDARRTIDLFINSLNNPKPAQKFFKIKIAIKEQRRIEYVWLENVTCKNRLFVGKIENEPQMVTALKMGDAVSVGIGEVIDWMYVDNSKLVGGYTIRLLRDALPAGKREDFDENIPFVVPDAVKPIEASMAFFDLIGNQEYSQIVKILDENANLANTPGKVAVKGRLGFMTWETMHPLCYAIYHNDTEAVKILLKYKADPNFRGGSGNTPLHVAASKGNPRMIELLADSGADIDARNEIGATPLRAAVASDKIDGFKVLIALGADTNAVLQDGQTILHNVGSFTMAQLLVHEKVNVNAIDKKGQSSLHYAFINRHVDIALLLIQSGSRVDLKDENRKTPIDIARERLDKSDFKRVLDLIHSRRHQ